MPVGLTPWLETCWPWEEAGASMTIIHMYTQAIHIVAKVSNVK